MSVGSGNWKATSETGPRLTRTRATAHAAPTGRRLAVLSFTALGVVYGDIGTSPLYAFREAFHPEHGVKPTVEAVFGILSMIVWSLILIVSIKYIALVMRADNRGEGGILALLALLPRDRAVLVMCGLFGAALLYGDGLITPAISVLGAAEGLELVAPGFAPYVVPFTVAILTLLFVGQRWGTARMGKMFGPITLLWFIAISVLGAAEILRSPGIVLAGNPWYAARFVVADPHRAFTVLGAVVLAVTGAEALYADVAHFGRRPIRVAWFAVVLPALLLNYFGQGALVLRVPEAVQNPFYHLAPRLLLYPLLIIATLAAIVASQALISGAFSVAQQSIQLGYFPRLTIIHTSRSEFGQIYSGGQRAPRRGVPGRRPRVPFLECPGGGLRHRGNRNDGDNHAPVLPGGPLALAMAAVARAGGHRPLLDKDQHVKSAPAVPPN